MIDVDKCVKQYTDGLTDLNEEQKQKFAEMATAMGNFLNSIWDGQAAEKNADQQYQNGAAVE